MKEGRCGGAVAVGSQPVEEREAGQQRLMSGGNQRVVACPTQLHPGAAQLTPPDSASNHVATNNAPVPGPEILHQS